MASQTTLFRPWAVGQVTPTSPIFALHPRPWLPSPLILSPVRLAHDPGMWRTLTTCLLDRIDQVLVRPSLWMLPHRFLCVARLAVFCSFGLRIVHLGSRFAAVSCGFSRGLLVPGAKQRLFRSTRKSQAIPCRSTCNMPMLIHALRPKERWRTLSWCLLSLFSLVDSSLTS